MPKLKTLVFIATFFFITSCNHRLVSAYYYDNTKVDDGEIFGEQLYLFFKPDENIPNEKIQSKYLYKKLQALRDSLKLISPSDELDDGYYGYAFVINSKDTLYADYSLSYWKWNTSRKAIESKSLTRLIKPLFKNPYLK